MFCSIQPDWNVPGKGLPRKTWGNNITKFGGIGGMSFLGSEQKRDLDIPRSHRHFTSCLTEE